MRQLLLISLIAIFSGSMSAQKVDPIKYAQEVKKILDERAELVTAAIQDQTKRYNQLADILGQADADQLNIVNTQEALREARELGIDYANHMRSPANWRRDLEPYLIGVQGRLVSALVADLDNQERYLSSFEDLKQDMVKIENLSKLVDALTKPTSVKERLKSWAEFGNGTKDAFSKLACDKVKEELAAKNKELAAAKLADKPAAEITALTTATAALSNWRTAKGCN